MSDELLFREETTARNRPREVWKLLIVDDEPEVHAVTELALRDFEFAGRELRFLHAYSGIEARAVLREHADVALILLDVVMETEHSGLDVVGFVRDELCDRFVRIVLRTGQPGQAPELEVITRFDINDYKHKTELTRERLVTTVYTSLSVYRDLRALDASRRGLEKVIDASARIFELRSNEHFAQGVLEQLAALLFIDREALIAHASGVAAQNGGPHLRIIAATGAFEGMVGRNAQDVLPLDVQRWLEQARHQSEPLYDGHSFVGYHAGVEELLFFVRADQPMSGPDRHLIQLFCHNVAIARDNLRLLSQRPANT